MFIGSAVVLALVVIASADFPDDQECPEDCDCHYFRVNYVTDCSESNFTEVPYEGLSPNVYILDLNGNAISIVEGNKFPEDVKMRRLQLAENNLTQVTADMFAGLKYILDVDLSNNQIHTVEPDAFRDSAGLITIELQNNPLKRINAGPFLNCRSLLYLDISNCGLSYLNDEFFTETPYLTTLYLSGNPLTAISLRLLSSLVTLEELQLSQCNLTTLHSEFLNGLNHLKNLDLSKNNFKDVDWATIFSGLPRMETLNLERSGLRGLPEDVFGNNTWIRNVDLSDNNLSETDIGNTLGDNLKNLHHLDLGNCRLMSLDERSFGNAEKLKTLDLSNNDLLPRELLTALLPLKVLTHLSLKNCSLTRLPKNIFENLIELKDLDLSWNPLNNVFEELLKPLQQLEYLNMGYSNLRRLNKNTFSQTSNLRKLVLSGNKLGDLEAGLLKELTKLETLELNNCGLQSPLDEDVFFNDTYTELQELRMAGNPFQIHDGPLIPEQLAKLKTLDLSNCSISYLPPNAFWNVRNVTHLYLHTNRLTNEALEKSKFLNDLHELQYLDLSSNNLTRLAVEYISETSIRDIKLTNNPWLCDCTLAGWWNWAKKKGDISHLVGATLTQEDIVKGGNKRKKALLCTVDPKRSPIAPRNSTRRTRVEVGTKTWARYLKDSPCRVFNYSAASTTPQQILFPEPILPSPSPGIVVRSMEEERSNPEGQITETPKSSPIGLIGGVSALLLAIVAVLGIYLHKRLTRRNLSTMEMPTLAY